MPEVELYDRRADPAEAKNLATQRPDVVKRQLAEIQQWIEAQKQIRQHLGAAGKSTMDPQTLERLRSLGYIGGKSGSNHGVGSGSEAAAEPRASASGSEPSSVATNEPDSFDIRHPS